MDHQFSGVSSTKSDQVGVDALNICAFGDLCQNAKLSWQKETRANFKCITSVKPKRNFTGQAKSTCLASELSIYGEQQKHEGSS